jgi:hypothetical protein
VETVKDVEAVNCREGELEERSWGRDGCFFEKGVREWRCIEVKGNLREGRRRMECSCGVKVDPNYSSSETVFEVIPNTAHHIIPLLSPSL